MAVEQRSPFLPHSVSQPASPGRHHAQLWRGGGEGRGELILLAEGEGALALALRPWLGGVILSHLQVLKPFHFWLRSLGDLTRGFGQNTQSQSFRMLLLARGCVMVPGVCLSPQQPHGVRSGDPILFRLLPNVSTPTSHSGHHSEIQGSG